MVNEPSVFESLKFYCIYKNEDACIQKLPVYWESISLGFVLLQVSPEAQYSWT